MISFHKLSLIKYQWRLTSSLLRTSLFFNFCKSFHSPRRVISKSGDENLTLSRPINLGRAGKVGPGESSQFYYLPTDSPISTYLLRPRKKVTELIVVNLIFFLGAGFLFGLLLRYSVQFYNSFLKRLFLARFAVTRTNSRRKQFSPLADLHALLRGNCEKFAWMHFGTLSSAFFSPLVFQKRKSGPLKSEEELRDTLFPPVFLFFFSGKFFLNCEEEDEIEP